MSREDLWKPTVGRRTTVIYRTTAGAAPSKTSSVFTQIQPQAVSGAYAAMSTAGVDSVLTTREKEKREMQDLNERFASYIEKVRFLEAQNRKLAQELESLKQKWGKETAAIKSMYQAELDEARKILDETEKEKAKLELKCANLEEQLDDLRKKCQDYEKQRLADRDRIERLNQQLADFESELNLLRRRVDSTQGDRDKDKKEIERLTDALNRTRIDLDSETLKHIDAENRRQTLEEEIEFMKQVHEEEMKELAAMAYRDTTAENREFWKNEMAQCLREIQLTYDEKLDALRSELEAYYNLKMQEFRTGAAKQNQETQHAKDEAKRLKQQLADLRAKLGDLEAKNTMLEKEMDILRREYDEKERELMMENDELKQDVAKLKAEMEAILKELQNIMNTKLGLELEIVAYRKLLEGEERNGIPLSDSFKVNQITRGEMSAKTTYQRSAKGPLTISDCSSDGRYITLENTGKKLEELTGWRLVRNIDNDPKKRIEYTFSSLSLRPGQRIKLWAGIKGAGAGPNDVETGLGSFGIGSNVVTKLINSLGEDRATHVQKTVYSS
ncbi:DgyrCDS4644 [Dimorphilus gyrociliatus]|uniref:DgyrCDS4644 n=1 Tax=Dimorphilus gyrociliatus TaxID=2664684 RepID=A0A7I8VM88_9ANNE|nr:DgyrCDS4644 [Dimorphilus gyrociliatus]